MSAPGPGDGLLPTSVEQESSGRKRHHSERSESKSKRSHHVKTRKSSGDIKEELKGTSSALSKGTKVKKEKSTDSIESLPRKSSRSHKSSHDSKTSNKEKEREKDRGHDRQKHDSRNKLSSSTPNVIAGVRRAPIDTPSRSISTDDGLSKTMIISDVDGRRLTRQGSGITSHTMPVQGLLSTLNAVRLPAQFLVFLPLLDILHFLDVFLTLFLTPAPPLFVVFSILPKQFFD